MQLQFQSNPCRYLSPAIREIRNTELTQEVRLSDGMPDIGRVLSSWGQVILRSKEWHSNEVTVTGGIMVWILYAPEDGTQPRSMDAWLPFQLKWELPDVTREGPIRISPLLRFVDGRSISARKMMVRAGVAAMAEALHPMEAEVFTPSELPEDIQILQHTYPLRLPRDAGEKTFLMDEDLQMPAGSAAVEKILSAAVCPQIQEQRVAGDKVIMRLTGNLHLVYRCPEGKVHTADLEIPVSQYAQLEQTYGNDAQADVQVAVTSLEADQSDENQIRLKCGLVAQYLISDRYLAELTEDAYSTRRTLEPDMQQLRLPAMLEQRTETASVQQQIPGLTGDVVDVTFLPDFPRINRAPERVMLELPGLFQILYYGPDGSLQAAAGRWEGNLQLPADADSRMDVLVQSQGRAQASGGVEEMNLSAQYKMQIATTSCQGLPMVSALELGELQEPDPSRPTLILCRSGGESLWDMAKRCGSTVDQIRQANGLADEPMDERMLLIPVN